MCDGDTYVLNGLKQRCSFDTVVDYILVLAKTSDAPGVDNISPFIADVKNSIGVSFGKHERKMGQRGAVNVPVFPEGERLP